MWTLTNEAAGYSGSGYMQALPDGSPGITASIETTSPELQFPVNFNSSGPRVVWVHGNGFDANGDSLHVGIDGAVTATNITTFNPTGSWVWTNRAAGLSKLKIKEMGSRYLFIVLYLWLEKHLSRGDYYRAKADAPAERAPKVNA